MVSVAPLFDLEKYLQSQAGKRDVGSLASHERDIRHNRISELLFVPHLPGYTSGAIVRLDMVCSVAYSYLQEAVNNNRRIASFTQNGFYLLLMKITYHFTRSESMDAKRS